MPVCTGDLSAQIDSLLTFRELGYEDLFFSDDEYEKQEFLSAKAGQSKTSAGSLFSLYYFKRRNSQEQDM
ncbi:MAG: hypothetical protein R2784_02915 [Saprospiraceae bacterium]